MRHIILVVFAIVGCGCSKSPCDDRTLSPREVPSWANGLIPKEAAICEVESSGRVHAESQDPLPELYVRYMQHIDNSGWRRRDNFIAGDDTATISVEKDGRFGEVVLTDQDHVRNGIVGIWFVNKSP